MVWEYFKDGSWPRWHDHPLPRKGRKRKVQTEELVLVGRREWGAFPNTDETPVEWPVNHVRTLDTRGEQCNVQEDCIPLLQNMQEEHMRQGMPDIQFNFMIGGDGTVYEGRGWRFDATRSEDMYQAIMEDSIDIAYIGKFENEDEVPVVMKESAKNLIMHGINHKYINCCHRLIPYYNGTDFA